MSPNFFKRLSKMGENPSNALPNGMALGKEKAEVMCSCLDFSKRKKKTELGDMGMGGTCVLHPCQAGP